MTQEIKPTYVTFEQAKLLKEKGFDELCSLHYSYGNGDKVEPTNNELFVGGFVDDNGYLRAYKNSELAKWELPYGEFSAPEQWQVVEWLRVNHGIWVSCYPTSNPLKCQFRIYKNNNGVMSQVYDDYMGKEFNSPQEAYLVAIDYILNNLI
jgi:hypothetical protein